MSAQLERFRSLFDQIKTANGYTSAQTADYIGGLAGRSRNTVYGWLCDSRDVQKNVIDLIILKINAGIKP